MSRVAVSGATGYIGRFIVDGLLRAGHDVVVLGRQAPSPNLFETSVEFRAYGLGQAVNAEMFEGCEKLVHAAFHHVPGKYRGGEGNDPAEFRQLNHDGSMMLFHAAKAAGVKRAVFLSSRAVYGCQQPGSTLYEDTSANPDSLYGLIKLETEEALIEMADEKFLPIIVRATGVYGASWGAKAHKWLELFDAFENGEAISPRIGTEVHGEDLAQAIRILIDANRQKLEAPAIYNVSDILLDRRKLLEAYANLRGLTKHNLPKASDRTQFCPMDTARLRDLGWRPKGTLNLDWLRGVRANNSQK